MNNNYYLAIQDGKYNLGTCPNLLVDKYLHNLRLKEVKKELIQKCQDRTRHKEIWAEVMYDIDDFYYFDNVSSFIIWKNSENNRFLEEHNWFVEKFGTEEENPEAYSFYSDLVCGI
jgi:hypothetical protein